MAEWVSPYVTLIVVIIVVSILLLSLIAYRYFWGFDYSRRKSFLTDKPRIQSDVKPVPTAGINNEALQTITRILSQGFTDVHQRIDSLSKHFEYLSLPKQVSPLEPDQTLSTRSSFKQEEAIAGIKMAIEKLSTRLSYIEQAIEQKLTESAHKQMQILLQTMDEIEQSRHLLNNLSDLVSQQTPQTHYDIFLSYTSIDQELANQIFEAVKSAGGETFLAAKSLGPGEDFVEEIRNALSESREVWLLVSRSSLKSNWVISETAAAWALGKKIVPILHRCDTQDLPEQISRLHCIDFYQVPDLIKRTF